MDTPINTNEEEIIAIANNERRSAYTLSLSQEREIFGSSPLFPEMVNELLRRREKAFKLIKQKIWFDMTELKKRIPNTEEYICLKEIYIIIYSEEFELIQKEIKYLNSLLSFSEKKSKHNNFIDINDVLDRDIEQVCSALGIDLRRSGKIFRALCPLHSEKSPSFTVYPNTNSFFCFGCSEGGNVINLVEKVLRLDFKDTLAFLSKV